MTDKEFFDAWESLPDWAKLKLNIEQHLNEKERSIHRAYRDHIIFILGLGLISPVMELIHGRLGILDWINMSATMVGFAFIIDLAGHALCSLLKKKKRPDNK